MAGDQAEGNVHFRGTQGVTVYSMGHYWWPLMHRVFGCLDFPKPVSGRGVSHWNDKVDVSAGLSAVKHVIILDFLRLCTLKYDAISTTQVYHGSSGFLG